MLLWLLTQLPDAPLWLTKITPRAALAVLAGFLLAVLLGSRWIGWLRRRFREPIVSDSPTVERLHRDKQSTPTMGGLFIVGSLVAGVVALADLSSPYVHAALIGVVLLAVVGAVDDLKKLRSGKRGLAPRTKLIAQTVVASIVAGYIYSAHRDVPGALQFAIPLTGTSWSLGWLFVPWAVLVIVGSSNAVNLADGLDGLAGGCLIFAAAAVAALAYAGGHAQWAEYLGVPHIPGCGEMFVVASCMIGGVLGFLWFNCHPAQVFMGDTGSLPLGGLLGILALVARQELLLVVIGGVFVAEALSVIVQVGWYKWKRRRLLLCAPLHHHFQFKGIAENKIVVRFWIASALCALLGVASVKLTGAPDDAPPHETRRAPNVSFEVAQTSRGAATSNSLGREPQEIVIETILEAPKGQHRETPRYMSPLRGFPFHNRLFLGLAPQAICCRPSGTKQNVISEGISSRVMWWHALRLKPKDELPTASRPPLADRK